MTTTLTTTTVSQVEALIASIGTAQSLDDLTEARARVDAMRAWAKVHGQVKELRLDLLRVEVEALARIVQLGGLDTLPAKDRKAAQHLASLSTEERASLVAESGTATTATGMCRSIWAEAELAELHRARRREGIHLAEAPTYTLPDAQRRVTDVAAVLANLVDEYTDRDRAFSLSELADNLIEEASLGDTVDPSVREGVREVCRTAIRRAPLVEVDGTPLPQLITARTEDGDYIRIPVANAMLSHLDDMRECRREQIAQDQAALDRLDAAAAKLRKLPGATDTSRIGRLVADSLMGATA